MSVFKKMSGPERVTMAKEKTARVVDHLLYLLELHENNAIIVYSTTLTSQIPRSYAANAFNVFQRGLHQFEIVRLCALWDRAGFDKENIPTIIELIDDPEVIELLAQETLAHWAGGNFTIVNRSGDQPLSGPELEKAIQRIDQNFGQRQAQMARIGLRKAVTDAQLILGSPRLSSIMNLRDKHLAHSLSQTFRERKTGSIAPMQYGDERDVLNASLLIVEALYCWVNGTSFSFEDSRRIDREFAEALWTHCKFDIPR
jgi:hypothetical protein